MKTRSLVTKAMALLMASAMVMGNTGMVVHASDDGCSRSENEAGGGGSASLDIGGGSSDSGSSSSHDSYDDGCSRSENEAGGGGSASLDIGGGSSDSGSSSSHDSYDDGCARSENEAGGGGSASLGDSGASYSAPAPKAAGVSASAGKEAFRAIAKAGAGTYKVMHKGVEVATFHLMDADKKAVACTSVALKLRDDGKYAINYDVADATGLTVGAPVDRTYMYKTLGVSYVTIGDVIVIDIESEATAAK